MASMSRHELLKGPIRPPHHRPSSLSYTQEPAAKNEYTIRIGKGKEVAPGKTEVRPFTNIYAYSLVVAEFSSAAVPQPFLDPSIIQRRIQAEKQWKAEQERKSEQTEESSSSRRV